MRLKSRERQESKLDKRLSSLGRAQLQGWVDFYLNAVGKTLLEYDRTPSSALLDEAEEGAVALLAAVRELRRR